MDIFAFVFTYICLITIVDTILDDNSIWNCKNVYFSVYSFELIQNKIDFECKFVS